MAENTSQALLSLRGVEREYGTGEHAVVVLKDVCLDIHAGEFVAIMGASGSGKSTLMNILGCLDKPTRGSYHVAGKATDAMQADDLSRLRREHFGFIFQRYHLMGDLNAVGNAEIPAIYAGVPTAQRHQRATQLLERLGLDERLGNKPGQLSGGQQQRVSIARALMNGGDVILADEPTGALDSTSGKEVMAILKELHADGHTIILVTHDAAVANHAQRIIEISDGRIVSDAANPNHTSTSPAQKNHTPYSSPPKTTWSALWGRLVEASSMALRAMVGHKLRTLLTMLGIVIGIAAVISVVALGAGSRQKILADISSMGTNTVDIFPGEDFGDRHAARIRTLVPADAHALAQLSYVDSATPSVSSGFTLRYGNIEKTASVNGVGEQFFRVRGYELAQGSNFSASSIQRQSQDIVIDPATRDAFFADGTNPIGKVIMVGAVPMRIIGVTKKKDSPWSNADSLNIWLPYTTMMRRITGDTHVRRITVRVHDNYSTKAAEEGIKRLLTVRHGATDFFTHNSDSLRETVENTTATLTLLISSIAVISLIVGGIGVMNIMLVSVTERTQEIGIRMAVGARQSDILQQFLIESVLVCLLGGILGVTLALFIGFIFNQLVSSFSMVFSLTSMVAAFTVSTLIGVVFGYLPAQRAAQLDPVDALSRQ